MSTSADWRSRRSASSRVASPVAVCSSQKMPSSRSKGNACGPLSFASAAASAWAWQSAQL